MQGWSQRTQDGGQANVAPSRQEAAGSARLHGAAIDSSEGRRSHPRDRREVRREPGHRHWVPDGPDLYQSGPFRIWSATLLVLRFRQRQQPVRLRLVARRCRRSRARPTRDCRNTTILRNPTSSSCPAPRTSCLSLIRGQGPVDSRCDALAHRLFQTSTPSIVIARGWRACSHASSAGSTRPIRKTRSGAPFPRTTSRPGTARPRRAASPIRRIATRIFSWLICESYDDKGNVITYQYKRENSDNVDLTQANERNRSDDRSANRYLKHVFYGNRTPYFPT